MSTKIRATRANDGNVPPVEVKRAPNLSPVVPSLRRSPPTGSKPLHEVGIGQGRRRTSRKLGRGIALLGVMCLSIGVGYWLMLPPSVSVVSPRRGPAVQAVYATGTVEPTVMVPIAARNAARLLELNVEEGSSVLKGQVLARLEDDDLRRAIEVAQAEERYAKAAFERAAVLLDRRVGTQSSYDRAKADWEKARATAAQVTAQASYLQLIAPADGIVIRRDGEIGQLIGVNQTVFWLSCCAPLRISAEVDEEDIAGVRPGQTVLIRSDAFAMRSFAGQVQSITPKGDPVARSYRVRISLPDDTPLMIGMTAETNIIQRQNENALLLPASAVRQDIVWIVKDNKAIPRKVTVGAKGASEVEIIDGLGDNENVIAAPLTGLNAGQRVRTSASAGTR